MDHIGLIDCNNFFVSCERLFRPDLKNKPVVVFSGEGGCVVARSKEIKDMGIPMGVPYFQIKDKLEEGKAAIFTSNFTLYRDISRRVFEVVRKNFFDIEVYSIDECFFYFNSSKPEEVADFVKRQVEREVGIPVSVGVSSSRTRAKYVNAVAKRTNGVAVWGDEIWNEKTTEINLAEIWGVGANRARDFSEKGLKTVADFLKLNLSTVSLLFGVEGERLFYELKGQPRVGQEFVRVLQKSIASTGSLLSSTTDFKLVKEAVLGHLLSIVKDLNRIGLLTENIRLMILPSRYSNFILHGINKEVVLINPTNDLFTLQEQVIELLETNFKNGVPYKRIGVVVSRLVEQGSLTKNLFFEAEKVQDSKTVLSKTILDLNEQFGKAIIRLGCLPKQTTAYSHKKAASPAYTTNWKSLRRVKA